MDNKIFGTKMVDKITGFSGTVTGRCDYITGCTTILLQPPCKKDGEFVENRWFDEDRLRQVDAVKVDVEKNLVGGDTPAPRK